MYYPYCPHMFATQDVEIIRPFPFKILCGVGMRSLSLKLAGPTPERHLYIVIILK